MGLRRFTASGSIENCPTLLDGAERFVRVQSIRQRGPAAGNKNSRFGGVPRNTRFFATVILMWTLV